MIRFAYLGVLILAGLLAYGGFALVRGSGEPVATTAEALVPPAPEPAPVERFYFLADQPLDAGPLALVLYRAGADGKSVVITDTAALRMAQQTVSVSVERTGGQTAAPQGAPVEQRIAALFKDDEMILEVRCAAPTCNASPAPQDIDFANLLDAAAPLIRIEETYDTYDAYLDGLSFVRTTPEFAFLGLRPDGDQTHPVPQQTPTAKIALPTIYAFADAPLDIEAHSANLRSQMTEALPEGVTLTNLRITDHGPAILVDADNRRPATRGGQEIPFDDVLFYTPTFDITGASALPEDLLETLTDATLQRVDWDDAATAFIASLGLQCPTCFAVQAKGDVYNRAVVLDSTPEFYRLDFYDLREAP